MSAHERNTCFDDEALAAMVVAYDNACSSLQASGLTPIIREIIGKQIIEAAKLEQIPVEFTRSLRA